MSINDSNYNFILDRRSASLCRKLSISIRRSAVGRFAPLTYCCIRLSFIPIARATCLTFSSGNSLNRSPTGFSPGSHLTICLSISHYFLAKIAHYFKTLSTGIKNNTRIQRGDILLGVTRKQHRTTHPDTGIKNNTRTQRGGSILGCDPKHHKATKPDTGIKNNTRIQRVDVLLGVTQNIIKPHAPTRVLKIIPAYGEEDMFLGAPQNIIKPQNQTRVLKIIPIYLNTHYHAYKWLEILSWRLFIHRPHLASEDGRIH